MSHEKPIGRKYEYLICFRAQGGIYGGQFLEKSSTWVADDTLEFSEKMRKRINSESGVVIISISHLNPAEFEVNEDGSYGYAVCWGSGSGTSGTDHFHMDEPWGPGTMEKIANAISESYKGLDTVFLNSVHPSPDKAKKSKLH